MRATSEPGPGRDFPIVWVCTVAEYREDAAGTVGIPWPLDAVVQVLEAAPADREPV